MTVDKPWLLIDQGNTAIKWRLAGPAGLGAEGGAVDDAEALRARVSRLDWDAVGLSSVGSDDKRNALHSILLEISTAPVYTAAAEADGLGLHNSYAEPGRMGVDRWLAMLAARDAVEGAFCVIDAGTAVTVDIVSAEGQHEGGVILPGPELMRRALMNDTGRIRVDTVFDPTLTLGRSTTDCVNAGVWRAALAGVQSVLAEYPIYRALLTGGGAPGLLSLGLAADHRPELVLEGLRVWLSKALDDSAP